jgi:hypothetical protein
MPPGARQGSCHRSGMKTAWEDRGIKTASDKPINNYAKRKLITVKV